MTDEKDAGNDFPQRERQGERADHARPEGRPDADRSQGSDAEHRRQEDLRDEERPADAGAGSEGARGRHRHFAIGRRRHGREGS